MPPPPPTTPPPQSTMPRPPRPPTRPLPPRPPAPSPSPLPRTRPKTRPPSPGAVRPLRPLRCSPLTSADPADYFPYRGGHAEDRLLDQAIRQGFFDRARVPREDQSARPALLPLLKHRAGLHTLSSLVASVLRRRHQRGRVPPASTFKPPPRVALTDAKRETWLRDLASPEVPLRRLARTIPHGLRGRALLDQCLAKRVPAARAAWLARCVGANEMRAFRRKGAHLVAGAEARWLRDWTGHVEAFLDGLVAACGDGGWPDGLAYA
ncbi:MAG: RNA polymerase II mediator complex subunit, partial [Thelocarpon impressellum]